MKIEKSTVRKGVWTVLVDANELRVASGKALWYSTWIGTFNDKGKVNVWMPAASTPRGYKAAAKLMLEDAAAKHLGSLRANSRRSVGNQRRWTCASCGASGWYSPQALHLLDPRKDHDRPDGRQCLQSRRPVRRNSRRTSRR